MEKGLVILILWCFWLKTWQVNAFEIEVNLSKDLFAVKYNQVYFLCKVTGTDKNDVTLSFAINGKPIVRPPPYKLSWTEGGILMIRPLFVGRSDGLYECVARDKKGTTKRKGFRLTVKEEKDLPNGFPRLIVTPKSAYLIEGETAIMRCAATGNPQPQIKWFVSNRPLNLSHPRVSLLSDGSVKIVNVTRTGMGLFECEASNSIGSRVSRRAGIFVKEREVIRVSPTLTKTQQDITVDPESYVTLSCAATGKPQPVFSWFKNGRLQAGGTDGYFHIRYIRESANYTCQARNDAERTAESTSQVIVRPKPFRPSAARLVNKTVSSITVTWSPNHRERNPVTGYIIKYRIKGTTVWKQELVKAPVMVFTYKDLKPYTFCEFQVIAVNDAGQSRPGKIDYFVSGEAPPETPAINLLGKGVSDTSFNATWDRPLVPNGRIQRFRVYYTVDRTEKLSDWSLAYAGRTWKLIGWLEDRMVYYFRVQVVGVAGLGPLSEIAVVKAQAGVPGQPKSVVARAMGARSISVSWTEPTYHGSGLDVYEVQYESSFGRFNKTAEFGSKSLVLTGLSPYTQYTVYVLAKSFSGIGPPSEPQKVTTFEDKPTGPPQSARARPRSSTSIKVFWQPPLPRHENGIINGYNIMYTPIRDATPAVLSVDGAQRSALLTGLRKYTKYTIWVTAKNSKGEGPPTNKFELFTDEDVPEGAPRDILAQALNDSALSVSWQEPIEKSGRIRGYFVYYLPVTDDYQVIPDKTLPFSFDADSSQDRHAVVVKNVEPSTTYRITVAAYTLKGDGARSHAVYVKTPKRLPPAPVIRRATLLSKTGTSLKLVWRPRMAVLRYKIVYGKTISQYDSLASERTVYVSVSNRTKIFNDLDFGVWYCFKVSAETTTDWSSEAQTWVKMPDGKPTGPPLNVRAVTGSASSIKVTWESPDPWQRNGKITKYVVRYKKVTGGETMRKTLTVGSGDTSLDMIVEGLQVNTMYLFSVRAFTSVGPGPSSLEVRSQTDDQKLPVVPSVEIGDVTSDSVYVEWKQPSPASEFKIIGYKVSVAGSRSYRDETSTIKTVSSFAEKQITPPATSAFFGNLQAFLHYTVSVRINTTVGIGQRTVANFKTNSAAPPAAEPPRSVHIVKNNLISVVMSPASDINGPIAFYHLCVLDLGEKSGTSGGVRKRRSSTKTQTYVTAELKPAELPRGILVGEGNKIGGYENKQLRPGHTYRLFVNVHVRQGSRYVNRTSPVTDSVFLPMPEPVKKVTNAKQEGSATSSSGGGSNGILIGVIVIGVIFVLLIVGAVTFFIRRRKPSPPRDEESSKILLQKKSGSVRYDKPKDLVELHRMTYPTVEMMSHPPIPVEEFAKQLDLLKAEDFEHFIQEFESIKPGEKPISEESNQPYNKLKNRYPNLLAYDKTRVVLSSTGESGSDYLNGNYIDGYRKERAYIATQGPMENTVADFWRACWENNTRTIVMMTKLEERGRSKCEQYWPSNDIANYGRIRVMKIDQLELANYTKRTFQIAEVDGNETRVVKQFQFTAWPDPGVPRNPAPLLKFIRRVKKENEEGSGPIIVHCSAGVGRTGCYIVIDSMLERIDSDNTVDIYGYVTMLRSQRDFMVQNDEQYIFVHDAVMDAIVSGSTEVEEIELVNYFKTLTSLNKRGGDDLEEDFRVIVDATVPNTGNFTSALLSINKEKNRCQSIVPYESNRVCLQQIRNHDGTDYVNASYIDGYRERKAFIASQGPKEEDTEEFWRMIMEHNCSIIVMLTNLEDKGKEMCHKYWPTEKSERYFYYVIEPVNETRHAHFCVREFKVMDARDGEARTIRQFQYINWPKNGVPLSSEGVLELIGQVDKSKNELNNSGPIVCHSNTGAGRSGVFIALSIVLERLQAENVIDIHRTVKSLRMERPFMVQTVEQYRFCFMAAIDYLRSFNFPV